MLAGGHPSPTMPPRIPVLTCLRASKRALCPIAYLEPPDIDHFPSISIPVIHTSAPPILRNSTLPRGDFQAQASRPLYSRHPQPQDSRTALTSSGAATGARSEPRRSSPWNHHSLRRILRFSYTSRAISGRENTTRDRKTKLWLETGRRGVESGEVERIGRYRVGRD